ncbi:MAG: S-adenosylmethionine decarboxylase [Planctomycetota bacterium]
MPNAPSPLAGFTGGIEWIVDASGCEPSRLRDASVLREICDEVVADLGLCVVGTPQLHAFPSPGGITALYLLSESHLACHTYPEFGFATFNLYCCRQRPRWNWENELRLRLGSARVSVRQVTREMVNDHLEGSSMLEEEAHS